MKTVKDWFDETFARAGIELPAEDLARRRRGKIVKAGWAIWYLFGSDESGEYFDYYASHRMTDDRHVRIYFDGRHEDLPAIPMFGPVGKDLEDIERLRPEFDAENQRIAEMLEAKGFGIAGDEPGGVQMNRYLRLKGRGDESDGNE